MGQKRGTFYIIEISRMSPFSLRKSNQNAAGSKLQGKGIRSKSLIENGLSLAVGVGWAEVPGIFLFPESKIHSILVFIFGKSQQKVAPDRFLSDCRFRHGAHSGMAEDFDGADSPLFRIFVGLAIGGALNRLQPQRVIRGLGEGEAIYREKWDDEESL